MRVGICAFWFNRGQGVVARQLRSALDELGHETFILGRPTKESFPMPQEAREDDVWAQEGVTSASNFFIPEQEYLDWASANERDHAAIETQMRFIDYELRNAFWRVGNAVAAAKTAAEASKAFAVYADRLNAS